MQARPEHLVHGIAELDHQRLFRLIDDKDALGTDQNQNDDQADQKGNVFSISSFPLGLLRGCLPELGPGKIVLGAQPSRRTGRIA